MLKQTYFFALIVIISALVYENIADSLESSSLKKEDIITMPRIKRNTEEKNNFSRIDLFPGHVSTLEPADIVFIIDRSHAMSKRDFYLKSRKLVRSIITNSIHAHINYTRLAVLTFAVDVQVPIDFISPPGTYTEAPPSGTDETSTESNTEGTQNDLNYDSSTASMTQNTDAEEIFSTESFLDTTQYPGYGTKAQIFGGNSPLWDKVLFIDDPLLNKGTDVKKALELARVILNRGRQERGNTVKQTVVLLSDGNISDNPDDYPWDVAHRMDVYDKVDIFTVAVGKWKRSGNIHIIASDDSYHDFFQPWVDLMATTEAFTAPIDTPYELTALHNSYCLDAPKDNSACMGDMYTGYSKYLCNPGYFLNSTSDNCTACDMGSYKSKHGDSQADCIPCPVSSQTLDLGSTSIDMCKCFDDSNNAIECPVDPCSFENHTCTNMGQMCVGIDSQNYTCECKNGFSGPNCTINTDNCINDPCGHNGKCIDMLDSYYCQCDMGYVGRHCEIIEDNCMAGACFNNGNCSSSLNNFRCHCPTNYRGAFCQDYKAPTTTAAPTTQGTRGKETSPPVQKTTAKTKFNKITDKEDDTTDSKLIIFIAGGAGGFLVLVIIISVICIAVIQKRRKKERAATATLPPPPELFEKQHYQKRNSSKSKIKKTLSKRFSGFWKPKTVRGGFDAEKAEGTPSAPTRQRPDLLSLNVNLVDEVQFENQKIEDDTSMNGWASYLKELEESGLIHSACITKFETNKNASTTKFIYNTTEVEMLLGVMKCEQVDVPVQIQGVEYRLKENNGVLAVALSTGVTYDEMLIVGKTQKFLVMAIADQKENGSNEECQKEVQWVIDHISGEGY